VLVGVPFFLVVIVAAARIGLSNAPPRSPVPYPIVAVVVVLALSCGVFWKRTPRRSAQDQADQDRSRRT